MTEPEPIDKDFKHPSANHCFEFQGRIEQVLDNEPLSVVHQAELAMHLNVCAACREFEGQTRLLFERFNTLNPCAKPVQPSQGLDDRVIEHVRRNGFFHGQSRPAGTILPFSIHIVHKKRVALAAVFVGILLASPFFSPTVLQQFSIPLSADSRYVSDEEALNTLDALFNEWEESGEDRLISREDDGTPYSWL